MCSEFVERMYNLANEILTKKSHDTQKDKKKSHETHKSTR